MKLAMRVQAVSKKVTLITTAFILAVSTLTASLPFILSQNVNAVGTITGDMAKVYNAADLAEAAANPAVKNVSIKASFTTSDKTVFSGRNVNIDGNGNTVTFNNTPGWHGEYVFQAYKISMSVKNLKITGGDAAIYANGSKVTLQGLVDVSGNEFGGIEVSQGAGVTTPAVLTVAGSLANSTEANAKPTAWIDAASVANATVNGLFTKTTHIGTDQEQYYLVATNAGIVATNITTGETFVTLQNAIDDSNTVAGNGIELNTDISTTQETNVTKAVTINGNGHTVKGQFAKTATNNNSVIGVLSDNVKIQDLTVDGVNGDVNKLHGINIYESHNVELTNVTARNGRTGVVVNMSTAIVNGIHTSGNVWHGVNVDGTGAHLTIKGQNSHNEATHLYVDSRNIGQITDVESQYAVIKDRKIAGDAAYVLNSSTPYAELLVNGEASPVLASDRNAAVPITVTGAAQDAFAIKSHWFEITAPNGHLYYWYNLNANTDSVSFELNDVNGLPLDNNGRAVEGEYKIRYVATDVNKVRSDIHGPALLTLTVDNTTPGVSATMSSQLVVTNNNLPTVTVNATDPSGVREVQYVVLDMNNNTVIGWTVISNNTETTLNGLANLADGSYVLRARAFDNAGNKKSGVDVSFTINRTISTSVMSSSNASATPKIQGLAKYANDTVAAGEQLLVTLDGVEFASPVVTDSNGAWELPVTVADGPHTVAVRMAGDDKVIATTNFTTVIPTTSSETADGQNNNQGAGQQPQLVARSTQFPTTVNPASSAQVLGDETTDDTINPSGAEDVKGTSTEKNFAEAATANTDGKAFGLAWYWWLLIVAGAMTIVWWIVSAVRSARAQA